MKSQTAYKDNKSSGFTLIEILVVMGIVIALFAIGNFVDFSNIGRASLNKEEEKLVSVLQKARNRSMNNIGQSRHGVRIDPVDKTNFIIFQETPYLENEKIPRSENIEIDTSSINTTDIIFDQLSGQPNKTGNIILSDNNNTTRNITILTSGLIDW